MYTEITFLNGFFEPCSPLPLLVCFPLAEFSDFALAKSRICCLTVGQKELFPDKQSWCVLELIAFFGSVRLFQPQGL